MNQSRPGKFGLIVALFAAVTLACLLIALYLRRADLAVSPRYIAAYYVVPAGLFAMALLGVAFASIRASMLMSMVGLGGAVFMADLYLAQFAPLPDVQAGRASASEAGAAKAGQPYDRRRLVEIVADLKSAGRDAWPMISPANFVDYEGTEGKRGVDISQRTVLPLGSMSQASNVYCNEGGQWLVYDSDRYGFQNPSGTWAPGTVDVALLGDSFAQGACVGVENNIASHLRGAFGRVANLGIGGSGQLLQLAAAREYLPGLKPRHVVWLFFEGNDVTTNLPNEIRHPILRHYLEDPAFTQGLVNLQPEIDAALKAVALRALDKLNAEPTTKQAKRLPLSASLRLITLRDRLGLTSCPSKNQDFAALARMFRTGREMVEAWGGTLTLVYLPYWGGNCDTFTVGPQGNWMYREVLKAAGDAGIQNVVDMMPVFAASPNIADFFQYPGSHYNEAGYRRVAQEIETRLKEIGAR